MLDRVRAAARRPVPARLRPSVTRLLGRLLAAGLRGERVECPCCGRRLRRFIRYPTLYCPGCGSYERHRLLCLLLASQPALAPAGARVLDVGPQPSVERWLRQQPRHYVMVDISYPTATYRMDVRSLAFADASFDLALCFHVLDVLPDPERAVRELARVTHPGGAVILACPDGYAEASGLPATLAAAGLRPREVTATDLVPPARAERYGLRPHEPLYVCTLAGAQLSAAEDARPHRDPVR